MTGMNYSLNHSRNLSNWERQEEARKRRKAKKKAKKTNGATKMVSKYDGTCARCNQRYKAGKDIYFVPANKPGEKCYHPGCFEQMRKQHGR
jgi:hypothetical protein